MAPPNTNVNSSMSITGSMIAMSSDSPSRSEWRRLRVTKTLSAVRPVMRGRMPGAAGAMARHAISFTVVRIGACRARAR